MTSEEPVPTPVGGWSSGEQVRWYLNRIGKLEARQAGEAMLADVLPPAPRRVLDLGCGDGRLAALVMEQRPTVEVVVAVDRSTPMLEHASERFASDSRVELRTWDLERPITALGLFDVIVSGFAIHHVEDVRKRAATPRIFIGATTTPRRSTGPLFGVRPVADGDALDAEDADTGRATTTVLPMSEALCGLGTITTPMDGLTAV